MPIDHNDDKTIEVHNELRDLESQDNDEGIQKADPSCHPEMEKNLAPYVAEHTIGISPEENKRIFWLVSRRILPYMLVTYCWQTLDKNTIGYAAVMGLIQDANLSSIQYSWLTTIVYLVQLAFQYPVNYMFQRLPVARTINIAVTCWGVVVALTPLCNNFPTLMVVRGLLGMFETSIQPGFTIMTSMWYTRDEQAQTIALWYSMNAFTGLFAGLLTYACTFFQGPIKNWQLMYLILGILTTVWGFIALFWVPDSPATAKCFSKEDKVLMMERLRVNQHAQNRKFKKEQAKEALLDPHLWCYFLLSFLATIPSGGVGAYAGLITKAMGFTVLQTNLLGIASGSFSLCAIAIGITIYRKTRWTLGSAALCILPQLACVITMMTVVPNDKNKGGTLFALYLFQFLQPQVIIQISLVTQNVCGGTKKSVAIAMNWAGAMVGNCVGPQIFARAKAPHYVEGFTVALVLYCVTFFVHLFLGFSYRRLNRQRDAQRAALRNGDTSTRPEDLDQAYDDLTDRQNPNFRYNL